MADADEILEELRRQRRILGSVYLGLDALLDRAGIPSGERPPPVHVTGQHALVSTSAPAATSPLSLGPDSVTVSNRALGIAWRAIRYLVTLAIGAIGGAAGKRWWGG
jgi:hypothetical protein